MLRNTAIIAMAGKPVHEGHFCLIERASRENDDVLVFVSTHDRSDGNVKISGKKMLDIWSLYLTPALQQNVTPVFCNASPVREIYEFIGKADPLQVSINIYGDPNDVEANFSDKSLQKYAKALNDAKQIKRVPIPRTQTVLISGTQMRDYIKRGAKNDFVRYLPQVLSVTAKNSIWEMLKTS